MKRICILIIALLFLLTACSGSEKTLNGLSAGSEKISSDWVIDYPSIIEEYRRFADYSIEGGAENVFKNKVFRLPDKEYLFHTEDNEFMDNLRIHWDYMLVEANIWSYRDFPKTKNAFGYAIKDLNENGSPELILLLQDYTVLAIFSTVNKKPYLLDACWSKNQYTIDKSGTLYIRTHIEAGFDRNALYQVSKDDSELVLIDEFGLNGFNAETQESIFYKLAGGQKQKIDEKEFNDLYELFNSISTKDAGFEFVPLF